MSSSLYNLAGDAAVIVVAIVSVSALFGVLVYRVIFVNSPPIKTPRVRRTLHLIKAGAWLALAALALFAFYDRYWLLRDCFAENEGRCWTPELEGTVSEGAGLIWSSVAILFLGLAVLSWWRARRA